MSGKIKALQVKGEYYCDRSGDVLGVPTIYSQSRFVCLIMQNAYTFFSSSHKNVAAAPLVHAMVVLHVMCASGAVGCVGSFQSAHEGWR